MPNSSSDTDVSDVISLLDDDCARQILIETMSEPLSANELEERCEVSPPTIYRRLEDLSEHELISEQTRPAADGITTVSIVPHSIASKSISPKRAST